MKKYKGLGRAYLLSYFAVVFGAMLFGLLLVKQNVGVAIAIFIVCALDLAAIITSRVMFKKHYRVFFHMSIWAFAVLNVLVLGGFILEAIYTAQGSPAPYAWMIGSLGVLFIALIDLFYVFSLKKIHHNKLVAEGLIVVDEEV